MKKIINFIVANIMILSCVLPLAAEANSGIQGVRENSKDTLNITWDGEATQALFITADYNSSGVMQSVWQQSILLEQGQNTVEADVSDSSLTRKYMVWDSLYGLNKLMDACTIVGSLPSSYDSSIAAASGTNFEAEYSDLDAYSGVVKISAPAQFTGQTETIVVLKADKTLYTASPADFLAVNQDSNINRVVVPKLDQTDDKGTYKVYIGTGGSVYEASFTIGTSASPTASPTVKPTATPTVVPTSTPTTKPTTTPQATETPSFDPSEYEIGIVTAVYKVTGGDYAANIYTSLGEEKTYTITEDSAALFFNTGTEFEWHSNDKYTVIAYKMQARNTIVNIECILSETKEKAAYNSSNAKIGGIKISSQTKILSPTTEDRIKFIDSIEQSSLSPDKVYDISAYNRLDDGSYWLIIINSVEDAPKYPYTMTGLEIENASGTKLDTIPDNSGFIARLSFRETIQRDEEDCVIVAVYGKTGVLLSLDYMQTDFDTDKDYRVGFHISKQTEEIGQVKAFIWSSLSGAPLCNTIEK